MSCSTLSQQSIRMNVSIGSLPEGFCPESMQDLGNAIAARLIITPNQDFSSFAVGSIPPTSNVGPWLKDCLTWYVFDDSSATYVPIAKGGFDSAQYFTANGTFTVPDGIFKIKVSAWGGGAGGASTTGGVYGAGGGGGGHAMNIFTVTPGQSIGYIVGSGGPVGGSGTASTFLTMTANPGTVGTTTGATSEGGSGGTATGGIVNIRGQGGNSPSSGNVTSGFGGSSPQGGSGGVLSSIQANADGQVPGGGGAGQVAGTSPVGAAGNGATGAILIEY